MADFTEWTTMKATAIYISICENPHSDSFTAAACWFPPGGLCGSRGWASVNDFSGDSSWTGHAFSFHTNDCLYRHLWARNEDKKKKKKNKWVPLRSKTVSVGRGISNDHQREVRRALFVWFLKGEREGRLRSLFQQVWSDLKTWQIYQKKKKSDSSFRDEESEKEAFKMKVWRGRLDQTNIRTPQAGKERMRKPPQRVTNPGLADWLADAAHEMFLRQTGAP